MAKPANWVSITALIGFKITAHILWALPDWVFYRFAAFLSLLAYKFSRRYRRLARKNLRMVFPTIFNPELDQDDSSDVRLERFIKRNYRHMFYSYVDGMVGYRKLSESSMKRFIRVKFDEKALKTCEIRQNLKDKPAQVKKSIKGLMFCTGHIGSWEIGIHPPAVMGLPSVAIGRPLDVWTINNEVNKMRDRFGNRTLSRFGAFTTILRSLLRGENIGFVIDQEAGVKAYGMYIDFMGTWCKCIDSYALLGIKYKTPVLPAFVIREGERFKFTLYMTEPLETPGDADNLIDKYKVVQGWHDRFAVFVMRYPWQYEWFHQKWRTRPMHEKNVIEKSKDIQPERQKMSDFQLECAKSRQGTEFLDENEKIKELFEVLPDFNSDYPL